MQHPIGAHALLGDSRTAALVAPDGDVAWLCWPRVDSDPVLLSILDAERGGCFSVRPRGDATVVDRDYREDSLVLRTRWRQGRGRLCVDDALTTEGRTGLLRMLSAELAPVLVEVRFRPAPEAGAAGVELRESGRRALAAGGGLVLAVDGPAPWRIEEGTLVSVFRVVPGYPAAVALGDAAEAIGLGDAPERMAATLRHWRGTLAGVELRSLETSALAAAVGVDGAARLLRRSAAVLSGLRQRGGGICAAPTTSLPQWPGSSRTWDYRYAWLRDCAVAARALLRLGLLDDAHGLGAFCGDIAASAAGGEASPLARVDEQPAPPERRLDHLAGHGGARPVRIGNAAALQVQHDVAGDVLWLAHDLARARALPESLRRAVPAIAGRAAAEWRLPDHGIWEVRGAPRAYTHSRVKVVAALRAAAGLAEAGVVDGDADAWRSEAALVRRTVLSGAAARGGKLSLHDGGGGADSALSEAVLTGFLAPRDPRAAATLAAIGAELGRGGLVDRYAPQSDHLAEPCAPIVFASLWLGAALRRCGLDGSRPLGAAVASGGELGLFGECADPTTHVALGNYPQVQSHAALVLCSLEAG